MCPAECTSSVWSPAWAAWGTTPIQAPESFHLWATSLWGSGFNTIYSFFFAFFSFFSPPLTLLLFCLQAATPSQTPSLNPCTAFASPIPFGHAGSSSSLVHPLRPGCVYKSSAANFRGNLLPSLRAPTFAGCNYLSLSSPRPPSFWFTSLRHTSEHVHLYSIPVSPAPL